MFIHIILLAIAISAPTIDEQVSDCRDIQADIASRMKTFTDDEYDYARFEQPQIDQVVSELGNAAIETDKQKVLELTVKLYDDFSSLDAFDDSLRRNKLI